MPISTTWAGLIDQHGSKRRILELYWCGQLAVSVERFIEDQLPPATIMGYRPPTILVGPRTPYGVERLDNGQSC